MVNGIGLATVPSRQDWHNRCVRLVSPHPGHLHKWLTSLRALPAICLCRFRECDTLFLGTARSTESQISSSSVGRLRLTPGIAIEADGNSGRVTCRVETRAQRRMENDGKESRGKREAVTAAIVNFVMDCRRCYGFSELDELRAKRHRCVQNLLSRAGTAARLEEFVDAVDIIDAVVAAVTGGFVVRLAWMRKRCVTCEIPVPTKQKSAFGCPV